MQMLRNKSAHIKVCISFVGKLTENVVLFRIEERSKWWFRRGANRNAVNVLTWLFTTREWLKFLKESIEITFSTQHSLASTRITLELFRTETFQQCDNFLLEVSLLLPNVVGGKGNCFSLKICPPAIIELPILTRLILLARDPLTFTSKSLSLSPWAPPKFSSASFSFRSNFR